MLGGGDKKAELRRIMESPFYEEYALKALPQWAPEEDVFVHGIMTGEQALESLLSIGRKYKIKAIAKKMLGKST